MENKNAKTILKNKALSRTIVVIEVAPLRWVDRLVFVMYLETYLISTWNCFLFFAFIFSKPGCRFMLSVLYHDALAAQQDKDEEEEETEEGKSERRRREEEVKGGGRVFA